ncbi:FAD assembly factor SdhE [Castellaniella caeni]|uniref:FAD assembly factor SdhE n=1 Tax=Castellaniella caeni TaxID=266123 RepID=UPI00082FEB63|nr:succinate dehydrogenase assembly factor 2 [Castellaniella caeni]
MSSDLSDLDRARLRWRARRGLLENDLIITRFLDAFETQLTEADVRALTQLFEMGDNELLDVLLGRTEVSGVYDTADIRRLVEQMKAL